MPPNFTFCLKLEKLCPYPMFFLKRKIFWTSLIPGLISLSLWYSANAREVEKTNEVTKEIELLAPTPFYQLGFSELYFQFFKPHKIAITLYACVFLLVVNCILIAWEANRKKLLRRILHQMLIEKFGGNTGTNRATLFAKTGGTEAFFRVGLKCLIRHGYSHFRNGCFGYHLKNLPLPGRDYLLIYARVGGPHENGSSTHFLVARSEQEINGWTPWAMYQSGTDHTELPQIDISEIRNYKKISDVPRALRRKVLKYMKQGKLSDFGKLRTLHRCSRYLWATPILNKEQEKWGILVVDSDEDTSPFQRNTRLVQELRTYSSFVEKVL